MNVPGDGPTWSDIATWYDDLITGGSGPHETALHTLASLLPDLRGETVLDVACGQGLATRYLAEAGAGRVVGVDSSEAMIALAQDHGVDGFDVEYTIDDAQTLASIPDGAFDGATCQLGLMDIPDLDAVLTGLYRVLRADGWFVFVIGHPCFLAPDAQVTKNHLGQPAVIVSRYLDERFWRSSNPEGVRRAGNFHRTLSTYMNALVDAGFSFEATSEPGANATLAATKPVYRDVPIFFAARVKRI